ncbi:MAG: hypothetical protein WD602_09320 [Actinomycetota bacterium]
MARSNAREGGSRERRALEREVDQLEEDEAERGWAAALTAS